MVTNMENEKKQLKLWQGMVVIGLTGLEVFVLSGFIPQWLGLWQSLIGELICLGIAVGAVTVFQGDFRAVFPLATPKLTGIMGTILIYIGASRALSLVAMIEMYLAPDQVINTSVGLSGLFTNTPFWLAILVVGISPAICEEAVFRGVFFNSLWNKTQGKWIPIVVTASVFGVFHGSSIRFFPTFLLGMVLGYLLYETNNMFYNFLFHAINNIISVVTVYGLQFFTKMLEGTFGLNETGMWDYIMGTAASVQMSLTFVGVCMIDAGVGIVIMYLGNYVLHLGREGNSKKLFPKDKRIQQFVWLSVCLGMVVTGFMMIVAGTLKNLHY